MTQPVIFVADTGNPQLNSTLETLALSISNIGNSVVGNVGTGVSVDSANAVVTTDGQVLGYVNQWMFVNFSTDGFGSNSSPQPANRSFYGILNSANTAVPTNFLNFSYTQIAGGFGTTRNLYYKTTGGRQIRFDANTAPQNSDWQIVPNGPATYTPIDLDVVTTANGTPGPNGVSSFAAVVYQANSSVPATPLGGSYNFQTLALTPPSGWANTLAGNANTTYWASQFTFTTSDPTANVPATTWSAPRGVFRVGTDGVNGTSVYSFPVFIYQNTQPGTPQANTGSWSFATGTGLAPTGTPATEIWNVNPPATHVSNTLWASYSTAISNVGGTDTDLTWSTPAQLATPGTAGSDGLSIYNYPVYQANSSTPAAPVNGSYNFGTRTGTPPTGWDNTPPALGNIWISTAQAQIQGTTGTWTGNSTSWSTPTRFNGNAGINGNTTVVPVVYAAKTTQPLNITTQGFYNFNTNTLTPPTASDVVWYSNIQSGWGGLTVWTSQASFVSNNPAANTANTTSWTTPQLTFSPGSQGPAGNRGFVPLGFVVTSTDPTSYTSAQLTSAFSSPRTNVNPPIGLGYAPIAGDTAQFYWKNTALGQPDVTIVKTYTGTAWSSVYANVISGNVIATGSITAAQLNTNEVYALTVKGGSVTSVTDVANTGFYLQSGNGAALFTGNTRIGSNLVVGSNAQIGANLTVGSGANIGANLVVGNSANIGANLVVGTNANIGANLVVGNSANIGANLVVGNSANIGANLVVGSNANIGANLVVGTNANIGANLRVGNSANIGANLVVGSSANIGANLVVGSSANIGNNLIIGANAQIGGNLAVSGLITASSLNANTVNTTQVIQNAITDRYSQFLINSRTTYAGADFSGNVPTGTWYTVFTINTSLPSNAFNWLFNHKLQVRGLFTDTNAGAAMAFGVRVLENTTTVVYDIVYQPYFFTSTTTAPTAIVAYGDSVVAGWTRPALSGITSYTLQVAWFSDAGYPAPRCYSLYSDVYDMRLFSLNLQKR